MKATRRINNKNQKGLLMFCLFAWFSASTSFAQSQGTLTGEQTQQAPPPTITSTPSSIRVEAGAETPAQLTDKESTFTYGAEIDFNSRYVWRGLLLDDGPVWQPSAWISAFGFTLTAWSNVAMTDASGVAGLNSSGLTMTYNRDWEKLRLEAVLDAYTGQQAPDIEAQNTMESSLKLSYPVGPLRIFTTHAFDVLAYRGLLLWRGWAGVREADNEKYRVHDFRPFGLGFSEVQRCIHRRQQISVQFGRSRRGAHLLFGAAKYFRPHVQFSSIIHRRLREQLAPASIVNFGLAFGFTK